MSETPEVLAVETLFSSTYEPHTYSRGAVSAFLQTLQHTNRLNEVGLDFYLSAQELPIFVQSEGVTYASSVAGAKHLVEDRVHGVGCRLGYCTGVLDFGWHHFNVLHSIQYKYALDGIVIGLEDPSYKNKLFPGIDARVVMDHKIAFWHQVAPNNSIVFRIPPRPDNVTPDQYYDQLAVYLGVYQNSSVFYIGAPDDPESIHEARLRRAYSPEQYIRARIAIGSHVSELLL
jgi:hypothetical protein